jgi:error-prone DNA polymerase
LWLAVHLHRGADDGRAARAPGGLRRGTGAAAGRRRRRAHARARARAPCRTRSPPSATTAPCSRPAPTYSPTASGICARARHWRRSIPRELLEESARIAARCTFRLDQLKYEYPRELVPEGHTPTTWLRQLTEEGLRWRWPEGEGDKVRAQVEHELRLVAELGYEPFFLTVQDIVRFARSQGSCARAAARRRTRRCASRSASPRWTRRA